MPKTINYITAFVAIAIAIIGWLAFREVVPSDGFYRAEFERRSGLTLSPKAKFVVRECDFAPHLGDYHCYALVELDPKDFALFVECLRTPGHQTSDRAPGLIPELTAAIRARGEVRAWARAILPDADFIIWGSVSDGKTIFFYSITT